jgi:phytoene synthase
MSINHYENFPVASLLLPKRLRRSVEVIYHFARQADDFADEGDAPDSERLAQLDNFRAELNRIAEGITPETSLFRELQTVISEHQLPLQLFHDLLDAFTQDVTKKRYANFDEVLDYCRRSANPVGRLMLHLYDDATPRNLEYADNICTALQLINFWQDIARDYAIGRIYLPQDDMARFNVSEAHIAERKPDAAWRDLLRFETDRARALLRQGAPLGSILSGRIGLETRMIIAGGERILSKLRAANFDMFDRRPVLRKHDWVIMLFQSAPFKNM